MTAARDEGKSGVPAEPTDPHPSREEHYDQIPSPGGAKPLGKDIGPNPAVHDGKQPPRSPRERAR